MNAPEIVASSEDLQWLASPKSVRARAHDFLAKARKGGTHFEVREDRLGECVDRVLAVTKRDYPDGKVPFHARWEHFKVGGVDRLSKLKLSPESKLDLVLVSVLLDAGAGPDWKFDGVGRSEGLALASLDMFVKGAFSAAPARDPMRVDAKALKAITPEKLAKGFRVSPSNPLVGVEGRAGLLRRLGETLESRDEFSDQGRPSGLIQTFRREAKPGPAGTPAIAASRVLSALLYGLSPMWPARVIVNGIGFGDAWILPGEPVSVRNIVPFHKLSQWLTYSVIGAVEDAGIQVTGVDELTGLPEYRNGGLFLDLGVLVPRDASALRKTHKPEDPFLIEWRALTVALLDEVGAAMRKKLGLTAEQLPLARILQGGTWTAGREVAKEKRSDGGPPLKIDSDGTVF